VYLDVACSTRLSCVGFGERWGRYDYPCYVCSYLSPEVKPQPVGLENNSQFSLSLFCPEHYCGKIWVKGSLYFSCTLTFPAGACGRDSRGALPAVHSACGRRCWIFALGLLSEFLCKSPSLQGHQRTKAKNQRSA